MTGADLGRLVFILGGARSGKSRFAQHLARQLGGAAVLFVATAQPCDEEMARRIQAHRQERPSQWCTLEVPLDVARSIEDAAAGVRVVLLDCLTLLVSNILVQATENGTDAQAALEQEIEALLQLRQKLPVTFIVVSNEVGMGVVPPTPLGRVFRDLQGRANQMLSAAADQVYFLLAGLPLQVKPGCSGFEQGLAPLQ